jgi:hypothetical protein
MEMLDHQLFGPFVDKQNVGLSAYELDLPARMNLQPVFYVGLLDL